MAFRVVMLPQAEEDAAEYAEFIARESARAASDWILGLEQEIQTLTEFPERAPLIPEMASFRRPYRHLHFHSHRIVFFVDQETETVVVARIYHGARDRLRTRDLPSS